MVPNINFFFGKCQARKKIGAYPIEAAAIGSSGPEDFSESEFLLRLSGQWWEPDLIALAITNGHSWGCGHSRTCRLQLYFCESLAEIWNRS